MKSVESNSGGDFSLQNALEMARGSLRGVPKYGSREVLIIMGSLTSIDPGNIFQTAEALSKDQIRVSIIGMGAELHVASRVTSMCSGTYHVALNEEHFQELLMSHTLPPASLQKVGLVEASLVQMGFPQRRTDEYPSLCVCHKDFKLGGYFCPRCKSKFCDLPTECLICGLTLVASPHLARSYHHLFPVPIFSEIKDRKNITNCYGCKLRIDVGTNSYSCPKCKNEFCLECDIFIHESLHNCPGCD